MVKLRNANDVLIYGNYELLDKDNDQVYTFTRSLNGRKFLIILNFTNQTTAVTLDVINAIESTLINNYNGFEKTEDTITLSPYQAVVCKLKTE